MHYDIDIFFSNYPKCKTSHFPDMLFGEYIHKSHGVYSVKSYIKNTNSEKFSRFSKSFYSQMGVIFFSNFCSDLKFIS